MGKIDLEKVKENRNKTIKSLQMIEEISNIQARNLIELIFQKYAELEGATNTAQYLNDKEYRIDGIKKKRKYISSDIIAVLEDESNYSLVDKRILFVALGIKKQTSRYRNWQNKMINICEEYFESFHGK